MNMAGDIRVRTDQKYRGLYGDLKNFALGDMHELFFLSVCLGFRSKKTKPLGPAGEDRFWSRTITPEEWACYYAITLQDNSMDLVSIKDDKTVLSKMEEYANGGIEVLLEDFLKDYCNSDLILDSTRAKELPKTLLGFIYEQLTPSV